VKQLLLAFAFFALLPASGDLCAQEIKLPDVETAYRKLSSKNDKQSESYFELADVLVTVDSTAVFNFIEQLDTRAQTANSFFKTRFYLLKAAITNTFSPDMQRPAIKLLCQQALNEAYETHDIYLMAFASVKSGGLMSNCQEIELAATYLLQAVELYDELPSKPDGLFRISIPLGEVLFHSREYEKSLLYSRRALQQWTDTSEVADQVRTRIYNTIAQSFEQLGMLDSAMFYYNVSLQFAEKTDQRIWKALNRGFLGQTLFKQRKYDAAKPLLEYDYANNKSTEYAHAAKSLQWLARIDVINGRNDSALHKARESSDLLKKSKTAVYLQPGAYLEMTYYTLADVHRALGNTDSFYHYFSLYSGLHDSLQRVAVLGSVKMSQVRIENEKNLRAIQVLEREKKTEKLKRNFLVLAIVLSSAIVFLYVKRLRLKQRHKDQLAEQQRKTAEAELKLAKGQMKLFTENIIEKTNLIEKLQSQLQDEELNSEQLRLIEEITHQTILTEQDWRNFKSLFEKIYPGFFKHLREKAHDITLAEQRMAALTRLHLTARQMASMLGISVDSVHKSRQRLRQRLQVPVERDLEETVAEL
jgi:DNA-binding CsgD family transcriptional regulator